MYKYEILGEEIIKFLTQQKKNGDKTYMYNLKNVHYALLNIDEEGNVSSCPSIKPQTNEDEIEVQTETLSLKAAPLANGFVKEKTGDDTTDVFNASAACFDAYSLA